MGGSWGLNTRGRPLGSSQGGGLRSSSSGAAPRAKRRLAPTCDAVPLPVAERWARHRSGELISPSVRCHSDLVRKTNPPEPSELSRAGRRWPLPLETSGETTSRYLRLLHVQQEMVASPRAQVEDEARGTAGTDLQCHLQVLLHHHRISWKRNAAGEERIKGPPMRRVPPRPRPVGASPGCCGYLGRWSRPLPRRRPRSPVHPHSMGSLQRYVRGDPGASHPAVGSSGSHQSWRLMRPAERGHGSERRGAQAGRDRAMPRDGELAETGRCHGITMPLPVHELWLFQLGPPPHTRGSGLQ